MAGYVSLLKYTQKGIADVKKLGDHFKEMKAMYQKTGARVIGAWLTMGEYDAIIIFEAPDDQAVAALLLAGGMQGMATSQTMRAFSEDEVAMIVTKIS